MKLPCYYSLHYQGYLVINMDGWYKIPAIVCPLLPNMNAAKAKIDEYENLRNGPKLFDNETTTYAKESNVGQ